MSSGNLFHAVGAATWNTLSPSLSLVRGDFWSVRNATMHDQDDPIQMSTCRVENPELGRWSTSRREDRACIRSSVRSGANAVLSTRKWRDLVALSPGSTELMHSARVEKALEYYPVIQLEMHCNSLVWTEKMQKLELRDLTVGPETFAKHLKTHLFRVVFFWWSLHFWVCVIFLGCVTKCNNNNNNIQGRSKSLLLNKKK